MNRPELIVFIGIPGSGKSSFYRERFSATHRIVSKDLMRNSRNRGERQARMIRSALSTGQSVVVDNTNVSRKIRAPLIALGRELHARVIGYYFKSDLQECLRRNERREGKDRVPPVALYVANKGLEPPLYSEGFDDLFFVTLRPDGGFSPPTRFAR